MAHLLVKPGKLKGSVGIPPSKSQTLRAILFASLATGRSAINNPLASPDSEAMIEAFRAFGADISSTQNNIAVKGLGGKLGAAADVIDAGNSGIVFRFTAAVSALSQYPVVITGDHSLRSQRPIGPLLHGLSQLGVRAVSTKRDGFAPVIIEGPLLGGRAEISGEDSQPVSALLIASAFSPKPVTIKVKNPGERPWIQLTLNWFDRLGIRYESDNFESYYIPGNQKIDGFKYNVPGDFSTASFPLLAALITGSALTIFNLDFDDPQGDKKAIDLMREMGGNIVMDKRNNALEIGEKSKLRGCVIDINDTIDALAPLAVLGCFAEGETLLKNGLVARTKECDRIHALAVELKKMGADIEEREDGLRLRKSHLRGSQSLLSHSDHRMAMALAVAAMAAEGESRISGIECVCKTYPNFVEDFRKLGANLEVYE